MSTLLEPIGTMLAGAGAIVAIGITVWQYFALKRQRRFELARRLLGELESNDLLRFAVTCIDWGAGLIPVPKAWRPILGQPIIEHDVQLLWEALRTDLSVRVESDTKGMLYRHAFVALFNHLERLWFYLAQGAIEEKDLASLAWLARQVWCWPYAKPYKLDPRQFFMEAARNWYDTEAPERLIGSVRRLALPASTDD